LLSPSESVNLDLRLQFFTKEKVIFRVKCKSSKGSSKERQHEIVSAEKGEVNFTNIVYVDFALISLQQKNFEPKLKSHKSFEKHFDIKISRRYMLSHQCTTATLFIFGLS